MFTTIDIDNIIYHLNYPVLPWAQDFITTRLSQISNLSPTAVVRIQEIISQLNLIITERNNLRSLVGIKEVGTSLAATQGNQYFQGAIAFELDREYKQYQQQLAVATSLTIQPLPNSTNYVLRS